MSLILKPNQCPFPSCGSGYISLVQITNVYVVICLRCGAHGPHSRTQLGAVALWNAASDAQQAKLASEPLSDEALTQVADERFQELDKEDAATENIPPDQLFPIRPDLGTKTWIVNI